MQTVPQFILYENVLNDTVQNKQRSLLGSERLNPVRQITPSAPSSDAPAPTDLKAFVDLAISGKADGKKL